MELWVHRACGVGQHERAGAQDAEDARRERHRRRVVAFVAVQPPLLGEDGDTRQVAEHEAPGVAEHGRPREARKLREWHRPGARQLIRETTQTRPEHDGDG